MIAGVVLAGAAALAVWPWRRSVRRAQRATGDRSTVRAELTPARLRSAVPVLIITLAGFLLLGPAGAVVAGLLGGSGLRRWRARRDERERIESIAAVTEAIGALVAELRVGAHPSPAADAVAQDLDDGAAATAMRAVSTATRLGDDVEAALRRSAGDADPVVRMVLSRLARAWALAQDHGLPLAEILEAVRNDLLAHERFCSRVTAKFAGPRASAGVLAGLPVLGLGLGQLVGAHPFSVLAATVAGQVLLLVGGGFLLAGVAWSAKLTSVEVLR